MGQARRDVRRAAAEVTLNLVADAGDLRHNRRVSSTRGIKLKAGKAYQLNVGGALVWIERVDPYPTGPSGVFLPEQPEDAYVGGIPGSTRRKPLGCFSDGVEVELSPFNRGFVDDLQRLRRAGTGTVAPPKARGGATTTIRSKASGRSLADVKRWTLLTNNPAFAPGTQSGLVQDALRELRRATKQEIADHLRKQGWKWGVDPIKATRWYVDVLVREGHAKEAN